MKKILFVCALAFMGTVASAQTKKCCKGKAKTCSKTAQAEIKQIDANAETATPQMIVASATSEAELLAAKSPNIEKQVCSKSGSVSFLQKNVCSKSGNVSYEKVNYDPQTKSFVGSAMVESIQGDATIKPLEDAAKPACSKSAKQCSKEGKVCCKKGEAIPAKCCKGDKSKKCSKTSTTTNL